MIHEAQFPAVRTSALSARRFVSDAVVDVPNDVSETIALIASELATNSVRHAATAFQIRVERLPDRVHLEVEDDGEGEPVVKTPGPTDTSGRGLQIVQALADAWGVIPKPESTGKTVWATIALRAVDESDSRSQSDRSDADHRSQSSGRGSGSSGSQMSLAPVGREAPSLSVGSRLCTTSWPIGPGIDRRPSGVPARHSLKRRRRLTASSMTSGRLQKAKRTSDRPAGPSS
jgi:anti-sigma regulatory factor (Ser/Thr protein kinase)